MKKTIILISAMLILLVGFVNTAVASSYSGEKDLVNKQQEQYRIVQPIPYFDWSQERDSFIQIYKARNKQIATHSVWRSASGSIEGDCPSIGYPIPYDTQLTNPLQALYDNWDTGSPVVEQPEPNGLYGSKTTSATWVRCVYNINGKTTVAPVYIETKVTAYPYAVTVNYTTKRVKRVEGAMPTFIMVEASESMAASNITSNNTK